MAKGVVGVVILQLLGYILVLRIYYALGRLRGVVYECLRFRVLKFLFNLHQLFLFYYWLLYLSLSILHELCKN